MLVNKDHPDSVELAKNSPNMIRYMGKSGSKITFNISEEAAHIHGFSCGTRVSTPRGPATGIFKTFEHLLNSFLVIGVQRRYLWFHVDGDSGASFWDNCECKEDYESVGIKYL
jgi:hypothetical protein